MSTWDALYASLVSLRTVAGRKAIVLLSDGVDDDGTGKPLSKKTVTDVLALARQVNVPIYAAWNVNRAPTQVWGSSDAEGRKFEVSPERRGDETRVRVSFEEKDQN